MIGIRQNQIIFLRPQYLVLLILGLIVGSNGLKCISCYDCPKIEIHKDEKHPHEKTCDEQDTHCVKKLRKSGQIVRDCGKQYMCRERGGPYRPWYAEVHCCQCDMCNASASFSQRNFLPLILTFLIIILSSFLKKYC